MHILSTIVSFLVALGVLVVVHEFGHYLVARWCGVKVLRFSVGFGAPLVVRRFGKDETEWALAAFPLGGYVKMLDEREGPVAPEELHRAFNQKSVWRRFLIVVAGPVANFLLAIFLYWILLVHGIEALRPVIATPPVASAAAQAGFANGDEILKINEKPIATWQDVRLDILQHAVSTSRVTLEVRSSNGQIAFRNLSLDGISPEDIEADFLGKLGLGIFRPEIKPVIGRLVEGGIAEKSGLQIDDEIISVADQPVNNWTELVDAIRAHPQQAVLLQIKRPGQILAVTVEPEAFKENGKSIGRIGIAPKINEADFEKMRTEVRYGPFPAIGQAIIKTWETSALSLKMLGKMLTGHVSWKSLSGPVTIADYAGQSAQMGWIAYLGFLALISISLGVLNLLPIPLLDGGHLMYYIVEIIKGSPVSERVMEVAQHIGMGLLFSLMALALYNDINRLLIS